MGRILSLRVNAPVPTDIGTPLLTFLNDNKQVRGARVRNPSTSRLGWPAEIALAVHVPNSASSRMSGPIVKADDTSG